jgi:hypothetical protein
MQLILSLLVKGGVLDIFFNIKWVESVLRNRFFVINIVLFVKRNKNNRADK